MRKPSIKQMPLLARPELPSEIEAPGCRIALSRVVSSNLAGVGYDLAAKVLAIQFRSGSQYLYYDVPPDRHEALLAAPSKGAYLASAIVGRYSYKCLRRGAVR